MLLDSSLNSHALPTPGIRRQSAHNKPDRPRMKKAVSSGLQHPRQTSRSGSHPESRTAQREKYVMACQEPVAGGAPDRSESSTARMRRKNFSAGSAGGSICSATSAK